MRKLAKAWPLVLALLVASGGPAAADERTQMMRDLAMHAADARTLVAGLWVADRVLSQKGLTVEPGRRAGPPARGGDAPDPRLTFSPAPEVTRAVRQRVAIVMARDDPKLASRLEEALESRDVLGKFSELLQKYGYSSRNVGDVVTAYLVMAWDVVHGGDAQALRSGAAALRGMVVRALLASPRTRRVTDAEKQQAAETLAYIAMVAVAIQKQLAEQHDDAAVASLRRGMRETTRALGVDLDRVALTPRGFVTAGR